ncbi:hypothetical protein TSAR_012609 [Trichomalopsis sarcophagae]|uniref:Mutator-like transposase domain-containing protein n=1 Tax=Trichomalopsis sarcophagae TaxID=543379 RepID=A0A232EFS6_9HYME|nr:hypothetical protein TSAR_012609 [Trichomalopsis sarcophagae]
MHEVDNLKEETNSKIIEGRRIVHLQTLGEQLICNKCKSILSLTDTVEEKNVGLASIFYVRCRECKITSSVCSDKYHKTADQNIHFDTNTKAVIGALNTGNGNTHLNGILSAFNIPQFNWKSFKTPEKKPSHLDRSFIFPNLPTLSESVSINSEHKVRVAASLDMGWFTRSTGRSYNSFSGTASLIGLFSKKVISYVTLNRKCKKCDKGYDVKDHDCRRNFSGTAKAMEPHAAVQLTKNNRTLMDCEIDVGIIIADNDSSSIATLRNAHDFEVVKQADKNHTSKGVVNALYKLQKNHKELTSTTIQYLQKCFNYSISQNAGSSEDNPDTYRHTNIGDGLADQKLFDTLIILFDDLAANAYTYSAGASSNPNESLNNIIVSKAPKSRMYGMSISSDIRVACAINKKNDGEIFLTSLAKKLNVSPGKHTQKYSTDADNKSRKRYEKS